MRGRREGVDGGTQQVKVQASSLVTGSSHRAISMARGPGYRFDAIQTIATLKAVPCGCTMQNKRRPRRGGSSQSQRIEDIVTGVAGPKVIAALEPTSMWHHRSIQSTE
jgi:hypothetical protein